jgi:hypothetical protein
MNSFEFKGNELAWVKKKVAKAPVAVKTAAWIVFFIFPLFNRSTVQGF